MLIQIRKLRLDEFGYDPPHCQIHVSNEGYSATQDFYCADSQWTEFGSELQVFPKTLQDVVVFGEVLPDAAYYVYLRAFIYDGVGHAALEVRMNRSGAEPWLASSHFYIACEVATLNRLGRELGKWAASGEMQFTFET